MLQNSKPLRMKNNILLAILALSLLYITAPKLVKMCQIRGWIPGAQLSLETISNKWNQESIRNNSNQHTFWISWGEESIQEKGNHRINLEQEAWEQLNTGDSIEIVRFPSNPDEVYLRQGIFANNSNFLFDLTLLILELGMLVKSGISIYRLYRKKNATLPESN